MTLANGSALLAADIAAATGAGLPAIQADNATRPRGHYLGHTFRAVTSTTPAYLRKLVFVAPFDALLEVVALTASGFTAASSTTLTMGSTSSVGANLGGVVMHPVIMTFATGVAVSRPARVLYQGGRARADSTYVGVNPVTRALFGGATYEIDVSTTSVAATSMLQVCLALRGFMARGGS